MPTPRPLARFTPSPDHRPRGSPAPARHRPGDSDLHMVLHGNRSDVHDDPLASSSTSPLAPRSPWRATVDATPSRSSRHSAAYSILALVDGRVKGRGNRGVTVVG